MQSNIKATVPKTLMTNVASVPSLIELTSQLSV